MKDRMCTSREQLQAMQGNPALRSNAKATQGAQDDLAVTGNEQIEPL
jgi:hypothetical protein